MSTTTIDPVLESQYNVSAARADVDAVRADWQARSEAFRATRDARLDLAYGDAPRETLDLFRTNEVDAPLLIFIHGGYWQRGDKSIYSFLAEHLNAAGVHVAVAGYTLCPENTVAEIAAQIRRAAAWLWQNAEDLEINPDRINVTGHSAGGHLTAMMVATDWPAVATGLPADLIKSAIPISGLFDLAPLRQTTINTLVGLTDEDAVKESPIHLKPRSRAPLLITVGGGETQAFHDQAGWLAKAWQGEGGCIETFVEPGADHFDVINCLAAPDSGLFRKLVAWLR
ncbi:MAG: alpha/beta hydrolase [Hyphomicrobiaceae bacterium]